MARARRTPGRLDRLIRIQAPAGFPLSSAGTALDSWRTVAALIANNRHFALQPLTKAGAVPDTAEGVLRAGTVLRIGQDALTVESDVAWGTTLARTALVPREGLPFETVTRSRFGSLFLTPQGTADERAALAAAIRTYAGFRVAAIAADKTETISRAGITDRSTTNPLDRFLLPLPSSGGPWTLEAVNPGLAEPVAFTGPLTAPAALNAAVAFVSAPGQEVTLWAALADSDEVAQFIDSRVTDDGDTIPAVLGTRTWAIRTRADIAPGTVLIDGEEQWSVVSVTEARRGRQLTVTATRLSA